MSTPASPDPQEMLAGVDLFQGLSKRQLGKLAARCRVVPHDEGRTVAEEGLGALAFHLVLRGSAVVSAGGREIRTLGPGEYFGEISMIDGQPRSASVSAGEGLSTLVLSHQVFTELLDSEPEVARALLVLLCSRLREAEARAS